jgi:hypothetical protein
MVRIHLRPFIKKFMSNVLIGIIFCVGGVIFTFGADWIMRQFGRTDFAEEHLRFEGGSRFFYKLIGIGIIFVGFLILSNIHLTILNWIGRTLFSGVFK